MGGLTATWTGLSRYYSVRERNRVQLAKDQRDARIREDERLEESAAGFRKELRDEISRLHEETRSLRADGRELRAEIHKLETTNGLLRMEVTSLNIRIMELTTLLKQHNINLPPDLKSGGTA